jgi:carbon-monoxide dehydrogenase large subunit
MDPRAIRKVNYIKPAQLPYTNPVGQVMTPARSPTCWSAPRKLPTGDGFAGAQEGREEEGPALRAAASPAISSGPAGPSIPKRSACTPPPEGPRHPAFRHHGDGAGAADHLHPDGVGRARHSPWTGSTSCRAIPISPPAFGSVGSRSLFVGGTALAVSAGRHDRQGREKASNILEASVEDIEYREGMLTVVGTDKRIRLFEIAKKENGARLSVDSEGEVDGPSWPNGTHICEVEIDPETGVTRVVRYTTVDDVGIASIRCW